MMRKLIKDKTGQSDLIIYVIVILVIFLIWRCGLTLYRVAVFDQAVQLQANWDRENKLMPSEEDIVRILEIKAKSHKIKLNPRDIIIDYNPETRSLKIKVKYEINFDFFLFKIPWKREVVKETGNY